MFSPWQMHPEYRMYHPAYPAAHAAYPPPHPAMLPMRLPLMRTPAGAFPVPESLRPEQFPPAVKASLMRLLEGPPKPAVTLAVMNQTQASMIAPDLPYRANV